MTSAEPLWAKLLRVLLGLLFVVSAAAKLVSIDSFEVYIYTYGFFSLGVSYVLARLCIFAEAILGIALVAGWYGRVTVGSTSVLTLFFTLFLCYAALSGRTDSCHCMGNMVNFNPTQSILKNALLLVLLLLVGKFGTAGRAPRWYLPSLLSAALLVAVFAISVPDSWRYPASREPYNRQSLATVLDSDGLRPAGTERRVVAFVTEGCQYCSLAADKLLTIERKHKISPGRFVFIAPMLDSAASSEVLSPSHFAYHLHRISPDSFVRTTYGQRPLVLLMEGDSVLATYHLRNINERQIAALLAE